MPLLTQSLGSSGAVAELLVGVNEARREVLERAGFHVPQRVRVPAQIDTGSPFSAVDMKLLARLDIKPIDYMEVRTPSATDQPQKLPQFAVSLAIAAENLEMFLASVEIVGCVFGEEEGISAMLGRDVLDHCLLVYDGNGKRFTLAF